MARLRIECTVNDQKRSVESEPERTLLEVLREDWRLTGTKYGCGEGACGACTVLIDDKPVQSCSVPVTAADGKQITTIEGLATDGSLHPVQEAFLAEGAFQCGYCTAGMIMGTVALLKEHPQPTEEQIIKGINGNICRCGGYPNQLAAIRRAAGLSSQEARP